jgi:hypothetical protein
VKRILLISTSSFLITVISGCSTTGTLYLIDKNNNREIVTFNTLTKTMEVVHKGSIYKGNYVTNSSVGYGNVQNFGKNYSYGTSQVYIPGNSGRSILFSSTGEKISCEFTYDDTKAIGVCNDSKGEKFDLVSKSIIEK